MKRARRRYVDHAFYSARASFDPLQFYAPTATLGQPAKPEQPKRRAAALGRELESQSALLSQSARLNEEIETLVQAVFAECFAHAEKQAESTAQREQLINEASASARRAFDLARSLIATQQSHIGIIRELVQLLPQLERIDEAEPAASADPPKAEAPRPAGAAEGETTGPAIYICHRAHEHDRVYTENTVSYLESVGVNSVTVELSGRDGGVRLQRLLDERPLAIVGYNSLLDQSWLPSGSTFLAGAKDRNIPVIQWIVDHPGSRWHEFAPSTAENSRYLFNSEFARRYFDKYCLPEAKTASMGGIGPNPRSRIGRLSADAFASRPAPCLIALSLNRHCGGPSEISRRIALLGEVLARAVNSAVERAEFDLLGPLETHLAASLEEASLEVSNEAFNRCFNLFEAAVQVRRRLRIFDVAQKYPVVIQSDSTARTLLRASVATLAFGVSMQSTIASMSHYRSVLSVSPTNDLVHDRTMNALNAGCVAIVEDNLVHREVFSHKNNALFFRYDNESLNEVLDIVCSQPMMAYEIASRGFALRGDPRLGFGNFHNLLRLALQ